MIRALSWLIRLIGARTIAVAALVILTLLSVALAIGELVPTLERQLLNWAVFLGVIVSWLVARTKMRGLIAAVLLCVIGVLLVTLYIGQLGSKVVDLISVLAYYQQRIRIEGWWISLDWQPLQYVGSEIVISVQVLYARVWEWLVTTVGGGRIYDPVAATVVWSSVLWLISTWAAWLIRRRHAALPGMLPMLMLLSAVYAYTGADIFMLVFPTFTLLLLMVIVGHQARENKWAAAGIDYSEDIRLDIALIVTPISVVLVLAGWIAPSISLDQITQLLQQPIREPAQQAQPIPESLGLKPAPAPVAEFAALRSPGLPRSHLIGSGPELSPEIAMIVRTGDLPPMPTTIGIPFSPPSYYWRASTYDQYTGRGWLTSQTKAVDYESGSEVISDTVQETRRIRHEVRTLVDQAGLVYHAGQYVAADRDVAVEWRDAARADSFHARFRLNTDLYSVDSFLSQASVDELRAVKPPYPDWISTRYLTLPEDTPQRVLALARDLTAIQPTPYDRAAAIESYVRTYSYTLDVSFPPAGRDVVDYFLFDLQQGYCDYYAAAMVVLARAAGLPARLIVGFASGTYDPVSAEYVVSQADAHSWVEIYFNEYGWIEFEPTSSRSVFLRAESSDIVTVPARTLEPLRPRHAFTDLLGYVTLGIFVLALVLGYPISVAFYARWLSTKSPEVALRHVYTRLRVQGRSLGVPMSEGDTPDEFLHAFSTHKHRAARGGWLTQLSNQISDDAEQIVSLLVRSSYSAERASLAERWTAILAWQRITRRLLLVRLLSLLSWKRA